MSKNKIKYGLTNVHRASVEVKEDGSIEYGTPVRMRGAVSLSISPVGETTDIAADDDPQYVSIAENNGYDGTIEFHIFTDEDKEACLGATIDENGCLVENKDDQPKPQALLFEFQGDAKATRHVLYNCLFSRPDIASNTRGESVESATDTLNITVRPAKDTGHIKYKTGDETTGDVYDNWYKEVALPVEAKTAALSAAKATTGTKVATTTASAKA